MYQNPPVISRRRARGGTEHNGDIHPVFCCLAVAIPCLSPLWSHLWTQQLPSVVASRHQLFRITCCLPLATAPLALEAAVFRGLSPPQVASDSSSFPYHNISYKTVEGQSGGRTRRTKDTKRNVNGLYGGKHKRLDEKESCLYRPVPLNLEQPVAG